MNWRLFFKVFLRNVIGTIALTVIILGSIGFLVAGQEGLLNGAIWGLTIGLMSFPFMAFVVYSKYWGDIAGAYGNWWFKKELEGEK